MGIVYSRPDAFLYPPQTLATVAASLQNAGHKVRAFDAVVGELAAEVVEADVIGVFISYATLDTDLAFIRSLRNQTSAKLIAFGPAMRFVGEEVLAHSPVDAVLIGEAEGFFPEVLQYLDTPIISSVPRALTPEIVQSLRCDAQGFVRDLDALPFPAWDLLPFKKYKLLTVLGSRGCPDHCAYCPYVAAQGHRFRTRTVESVLSELAWLNERFHPARLVFRDPVFAHDRERVVAICEGILQRGLHLHWECESRPEHFDARLLQLMRRAGCHWVKIGLETTDQALLQRLQRVSSAEEALAYLRQVADVVRICGDIGLPCRLFVMAGLPGQNVAMAQHTRRFVEQLQPAALNVKLYEKYPGIDLEAMAESDTAAQMEVLHQAQVALKHRQSSPALLARGKRWLKGILRGGRHE